MGEDNILVLSDKNIIPTDEYIFSIMGDRKLLWQEIAKYISNNYTGSSGSWNYYNDGKQWLFKMTQKKKTIFWAGLMQDTFRITFYFGDKAESLIFNSDLPDSLKNDFRTTKRYGQIRAITLKVYNQSDIDIVLKLISIKQRIK
jgi:hypothetical protein